jgi:pimeloyl-ACP methyl ester carboxylesterase
MPKIQCRDIEIDYTVYGDRSNPVLIGVQGLAEGWRFWPASLCNTIVDAGFCFIPFDNRDIGGSTVFAKEGPADLGAAVAELADGKLPKAPYTVADLGDDIVAFMDALEIPAAHIIGYSMGGVACQWATINHQERILSLIPLMTTSRAPDLPQARDSATTMAFGLMPPPISDADSRARVNTMWEVTTGSSYPAAPGEGDAFADLMIKTGFRPDAISRQMLSNYAAPPHHDRLSELTCPVTVIHGTDDCFFSTEHGEDIAKRIPGARLELIEGAGHNFAESLMPTLGDRIITHLKSCDRKS